jgi:phage/plasmid-associated DNA primase
MLVDYTASDRIRAKVEQMKLIKATALGHGGMEIFYGTHNQVIPPSATIDKTTGKVGKARQFKDPAHPFKIIDTNPAEEEWLEGFLDRIIKHNGTPAPKPARTATPPVVSEDEPAEEKEPDMYYELLAIIGNKGLDRDEWLEIVGCLLHNKYPKKMLMDFVDEAWKSEASTLWDNFKKKPRPVSIYTLEKIAKKHQYDKYRDWLIKNKKYLKLPILRAGANDIAQFIAPVLSTQVKYFAKVWWTYDPHTALWKANEEPRAKIITFLQAKIDEAKATLTYTIDRTDDEEIKKGLQKYEKEYIQHRAVVASGGFADNLKKYLTDYLYEKDCNKLFDRNLGVLPFKNGVLDLKTKKFRNGLKQTDYLTRTIDFNYQLPTDEQKARVRKELKKICNWNDKHLDYYASTFGYALTGEASKEQVFFYMRGQKASNGKSTLPEALNLILKGLCTNCTSTTFSAKNAQIHKAVGTWGGLKILWVDEMEGKQNDEILKQTANGTAIKYNKMYAEEQEMEIGFKLFVASNHTMESNGDEGVNRRHILLQMNSDFREHFAEDNYETCEFKVNKKLPDELANELKYAVIDLLTDYSKAYYDDGGLKPYPPEWAEENKDAIADNNKFKSWFEDTFECGADEEVYQCHKEELEWRLKQSGYDKIKWKDKLTGMKVKFRYDSQARQGRRKGWYYGFRPIPDEEGAGEDDKTEC